ncbi:hypothetical protein BDB00DRAFT_800347 [Zychaea mexicana]|uniref:uncharacterized protein n=1 Tax=Zychaea mexicana TaxID=64656 RepID=UPI0022FE6DAA|nr:uncharacterized protein BDB00DRAFT_800347 [Zychaea mexicana]KAI9498444.1 hypothetical protein BDB00DRAFT_800347 [Zychaea mexicana]
MRSIVVLLLAIVVMLPMATWAFEFKNILFGGSSSGNEDIAEQQDRSFGVPEQRRPQRQPVSSLENCKGYVCHHQQQQQAAEAAVAGVCVQEPIDCPCPHPLETKQRVGEWYACVRTGL